MGHKDQIILFDLPQLVVCCSRSERLRWMLMLWMVISIVCLSHIFWYVFHEISWRSGILWAVLTVRQLFTEQHSIKMQYSCYQTALHGCIVCIHKFLRYWPFWKEIATRMIILHHCLGRQRILPCLKWPMWSFSFVFCMSDLTCSVILSYGQTPKSDSLNA